MTDVDIFTFDYLFHIYRCVRRINGETQSFNHLGNGWS